VSLQNQIDEALKTAMKAREAELLNTLRMVKAALKNEEIQLGHPLEDEESVKVLMRLCKQRKESIEQFTRGGRAELAAQEERELRIIEGYLPAAPGQDEIDQAIREAIAESGASDVKAMGKVMGLVTARFKGRPVDGKALSAAVRQALSG
jgi:uncharacterized protein YqeY